MPVVVGINEREAEQEAKKFLALTLGAMLEEGKTLPEPKPSQNFKLKTNEKAVSLGVKLSDYEERHLANQHWHIIYDQYFEAMGFKNEQGTWDIFYDDFQEPGLFPAGNERDADFGILLFQVDSYDEAYEKFYQWVKIVLLPYRQLKGQ
jgi:hypothetical protein